MSTNTSDIVPDDTNIKDKNCEISLVDPVMDLSKIIVVIVDFENISKQSDIIKLTQFIKDAMNYESEYCIKMVKIAGYCSSVKGTADIVVRSNRKDAVDHYVSYYIGLLEAQPNPPKKIYVISRDNFGSCLQDFCKNVEHNSDVNDFINVFNIGQ